MRNLTLISPDKNKLFRNKYRIKSIRLEGWDYSADGYYSITICTKNRECVLGDIINGRTKLSIIGEIIFNNWHEIPNHFEDVILDEFVIMPNHLHGIIIVENNNNFVKIPVETIHELSLPKHRRKMLIPTIIGKFKMQTAKSINTIRKTAGNPFWQRGYYEHIIRNERKLHIHRNYIINNPKNWESDKNNPRNWKILQGRKLRP